MKSILTETSVDWKAGQVLLINKPLDWTSFDVVNKIRYRVKGKVGHAGTLDPKATGLLIVCVGKKTKTIESLMGLNKSYLATIKLGATTASYDVETDEENIKDVAVTESDIQSILPTFTGEIQQVPPKFSALKKNGIPLYKLAREGQEVEIPARPVYIEQINLLSYKAPFAKIQVECGKGTYIRSLAHDIGQVLECGGYLTALERTKIGDFSIEEAISIDEFCDFFDSLQNIEQE